MSSGANKALSVKTGFLSKLFGSGKNVEPKPYILPQPTGPITLKDGNSNGCTLFVVLGIALFWNGIISMFFLKVVGGWFNGNIDWMMTLILIPFGLVGIALILGVLYFALAMFNPKPVLTIEESVVPLGDSVKLLWQIDGKASAFQRITITLIGELSATYQRGTDTITDVEPFLEQTLLETDDPTEMTDGRIDIQIPEHAMHSWDASNNKVIWKIKLHGDIPKWPDVKSEFPITITPQTS